MEVIPINYYNPKKWLKYDETNYGHDNGTNKRHNSIFAASIRPSAYNLTLHISSYRFVVSDIEIDSGQSF